MPEVIVEYKNKKSLKILEDLGKLNNFRIVETKEDRDKKKKKILNSIKQGMKEVKLIREGKIKPKTMQQFLDEL